MKSRAIVLIIVALVALPLNSNAQVGKLLKRKLQEAAQTGTDKKADENKEKNRNSLMGLLGGGDATYEQSYSFVGRIVMEMTAYGDEGEDDSVIDYVSYLNEESGDVAIEVKPVSGEVANAGATLMTMVYDLNNNCAIVLSVQGEQKTAIITGMDKMEEEIEESETIDDMPEYTKSGRTKTISGYKCEEYVYVDGDSKTSMWVTHDMKQGPKQKQMNKAGMTTWYGGPDGGGMMMEMEAFEAGELTMTMIMKDIDMKYSKSLSLDGFMIMNVGGK
ncbi:MAG: DUF4412 domain-containing protein [Bacteroidales bacterium]|nr:DUF4412 domain-containing protein [Bacteroidales bacterium]